METVAQNEVAVKNDARNLITPTTRAEAIALVKRHDPCGNRRGCVVADSLSATSGELNDIIGECERYRRMRPLIADASQLETTQTALQAIRDLQPRPYEHFPADWHEQIAACAECKRWDGHPIQRGICDLHRRPLYARERHNQFEQEALGARASLMARDALFAIRGEA